MENAYDLDDVWENLNTSHKPAQKQKCIISQVHVYYTFAIFPGFMRYFCFQARILFLITLIRNPKRLARMADHMHALL